jgi:hypothetical protein
MIRLCAVSQHLPTSPGEGEPEIAKGIQPAARLATSTMLVGGQPAIQVSLGRQRFDPLLPNVCAVQHCLERCGRLLGMRLRLVSDYDDFAGFHWFNCHALP